MLSEVVLQITQRLSVPSASTACAVFNVHCSGGLAALTLGVVLVLAVANAAAAKIYALLISSAVPQAGAFLLCRTPLIEVIKQEP